MLIFYFISLILTILPGPIYAEKLIIKVYDDEYYKTEQKGEIEVNTDEKHNLRDEIEAKLIAKGLYKKEEIFDFHRQALQLGKDSVIDETTEKLEGKKGEHHGMERLKALYHKMKGDKPKWTGPEIYVSRAVEVKLHKSELKDGKMKEEELKEGGKPLTVRLRTPYTYGTEIEERIQQIVEKSATLKGLKYYVVKDNCDVNSGGTKIGSFMSDIKAETKLCLYVSKEITHEIPYEIKGGQLMKKVKGGDAVAVKEDEIKNEDVHNTFWQESEVLASGKLTIKQFTDKRTGQEDIWKALIDDNKLYGYKVNEIEAVIAGEKKKVDPQYSSSYNPIDILKVEKLTALIKADIRRQVLRPKATVVTELGNEPAGQKHLTVPGQQPGETHTELKDLAGIIYIGAFNTGALLKEKIRAIGGADEKHWRSIQYIYRVSTFLGTRWGIDETAIKSASDVDIIEAYDKKYKDPRFGMQSEVSTELGRTEYIRKSFQKPVEGTMFKYEYFHKENSFSGTTDTFTRYVTLQGQPGYFQRPMTKDEIQKVFGPGGLHEMWEKGMKVLEKDFVNTMGALVSSTIEAAKQAQVAQQGQANLPAASSQGSGAPQMTATQGAQTGHGGIRGTIAKSAAKGGLKLANEMIKEHGGVEKVFGSFLGGEEGGLGGFF